jgi:hypothetical protein
VAREYNSQGVLCKIHSNQEGFLFLFNPDALRAAEFPALAAIILVSLPSSYHPDVIIGQDYPLLDKSCGKPAYP